MQGLWLNMDIFPSRSAATSCIVQIFSHEESTLVTGRGHTLAVAVAELHERFFALGLGA